MNLYKIEPVQKQTIINLICIANLISTGCCSGQGSQVINQYQYSQQFNLGKELLKLKNMNQRNFKEATVNLFLLE